MVFLSSVTRISGGSGRELFFIARSPLLGACNGIFTDQSIFRDFSREIGQFQSTGARFWEDKTVRPHVNMSTLVRACDYNWLLRFPWGSEFEINSN